MAEKDLQITGLSAGLNNTDSSSALAEDECTVAENAEFFYSSCGERRNGCGPMDITGSALNTEAEVVFLTQWLPTNKVLEPEYLAVAATPGVSATWARRSVSGVWSEVIPPADCELDLVEGGDIYAITSQSLNGKLFLAYPNTGQDRLQVWDGIAIRNSGLKPIGAATPVVASEGSGTFAATRYYRTRYVVKSGSVVLRRSEPSHIALFPPPGTGAGARVNRTVLLNDGETDWEVEASLNNVDFYRIATLGIGTLFYDDTTSDTVGYAAEGILSEAIDTYHPIHSAKFLAIEGDRLIVGGHQSDLSKQSLVGWTPVQNDPGVGNDERLPFGPNNTVNLDNYDGGPLTGVAPGALGTWYAFKWKRIYRFSRTGNFVRAYENVTLSSTSGAIEGSIVQGVDENGVNCLYFLDPSQGPTRLGSNGLQVIVGLRETWKRVNLRAGKVVARGIYYADKQQVHWWLSVDGNDQPSLKIVLQVTEIHSKKVAGGNGVGGGWSTATGRIAEALCVAIFTEIVSIAGVVQVSNRPFIGLTAPDFIQRCDVESTDAGVPYRTVIRTRPYIAAGLLNQWGAMTAALLATANVGSSVVISFIRDFGVESQSRTTNLVPVGAETEVIKAFDDLVISEAVTIQVEIADPEV